MGQRLLLLLSGQSGYIGEPWRGAAFSPIEDSKLPENICGLLLGGGYPENYARELSCNDSMRQSIARAIQENMPCLAECGGFLYLHDAITDIDGEEWAMVSVVHATAAYQGKLQPRFGYITLEDGQTGMQIRDMNSTIMTVRIMDRNGQQESR